MNVTIKETWLNAIACLDDETRATTLLYITDYIATGKVHTSNAVALAFLSLIRAEIDSDNARRENGKKGGRPTAKKPNENLDHNLTRNLDHNLTDNLDTNLDYNLDSNLDDTTISSTTIKTSNINNNIYINNNNITRKKENREKKEKKESKARPRDVEEVAEYCRQRGNGVDPYKFYDYYESCGWKTRAGVVKDWRARVRTWERSEYNGNNNNKTQENGKEQRKQAIAELFGSALRTSSNDVYPDAGRTSDIPEVEELEF